MQRNFKIIGFSVLIGTSLFGQIPLFAQEEFKADGVSELCERGALELKLAWEQAGHLSKSDFRSATGHGKHIALAVSGNWSAILDALQTLGPDAMESAEMLNAAGSAGHADIVREIIGFGVHPDGAGDVVPLLSAADCNQTTVVRVLLESGAVPNASIEGNGNAMVSAILHQNALMAEELLAAGFSVQRSHQDLEFYSTMLRKSGLDLNEYPWSLLQ